MAKGDESKSPEPAAPTGNVYERLGRLRSRIGAVEKGGRNEFDKYDYRSIDDLYNALGPRLAEEGLTVEPNVLTPPVFETVATKNGSQRVALVQVAYRFRAPDGSGTEPVAVWGEGADRGDKALNKAFTAAYKVWLVQAFCIPTESTDSEQDSPDLVSGAPAQRNGNGRHGVPSAQQKPSGPPTPAQIGKIKALKAQHNLSEKYLQALSGELFQRERPATASEAAALIERIEQDAAKVESRGGE